MHSQLWPVLAEWTCGKQFSWYLISSLLAMGPEDWKGGDSGNVRGSLSVCDRVSMAVCDCRERGSGGRVPGWRGSILLCSHRRRELCSAGLCPGETRFTSSPHRHFRCSTQGRSGATYPRRDSCRGGRRHAGITLLDAQVTLQDHKAVGEGDTGPNTGGMGAYSPAPVVTPEIEAQVRGRLPGQCPYPSMVDSCARACWAWKDGVCGWKTGAGVVQVMEEIVQRTASAMVDRGIPFSGVLFAGLMIKNGKVCCPLPASSHSRRYGKFRHTLAAA